MSKWREEWASKKIELSERLFKGECKGSYPDSVLLISAVINAISAELWPGRKIDKKRFVELLVTLSPANPSPTTISVPLLIQNLDNKNHSNEILAIKGKYLNVDKSLILLGRDVDILENDIVRLCPNLKLSDIRKSSYANIFYDEVRSSYVHEYRAGDKSDSSPMTSAINAKVSYINTIREERRIHFHIAWLGEVALLAAKNADSLQEIPLATPTKWWMEG